MCLDDDDFYPPSRVSHAVFKLNQQKRCIIAEQALYFVTTTILRKFTNMVPMVPIAIPMLLLPIVENI